MKRTVCLFCKWQGFLAFRNKSYLAFDKTLQEIVKIIILIGRNFLSVSENSEDRINDHNWNYFASGKKAFGKAKGLNFSFQFSFIFWCLCEKRRNWATHTHTSFSHYNKYKVCHLSPSPSLSISISRIHTHTHTHTHTNTHILIHTLSFRRLPPNLSLSFSLFHSLSFSLCCVKALQNLKIFNSFWTLVRGHLPVLSSWAALPSMSGKIIPTISLISLRQNLKRNLIFTCPPCTPNVQAI